MRLYVGNVSYETKDSDLLEYFAAYGVTDVELVRDQNNPTHLRGFAFVVIPDHEQALRAIRELDRRPFLGRCITIQRANMLRGDRSEDAA